MQDLQNMKDRIDTTMRQYQNLQHQFMQPQQAPITQNFQKMLTLKKLKRV